MMSEETGSRLGAALHKLAGMVQTLAKDGTNDHHGYDYVTEASVKRQVRKWLHACDLVLVDVTMEPLPGITPTAAVVKVALRIAHKDDPGYSIELEGLGGDQDKSGKAVMKATAAAIKYALTTGVLAPTGDDPEANAEADALGAGGVNGAAAARKPRGRKAAAADPEHPENW